MFDVWLGRESFTPAPSHPPYAHLASTRSAPDLHPALEDVEGEPRWNNYPQLRFDVADINELRDTMHATIESLGARQAQQREETKR